jgi:hypothetical protein
MMRFWIGLWVGLVLLGLAGCGQSTPDVALVSSTGVPVEERFEAAYLALGGPRTLGEPITRGFAVGENGRFTQYFERARLDEAAGGVVPYPLGMWAFEGVNQTAVVPGAMPANAQARTFASGIQVFDAFLAFYDIYDGATLLGEPISPQFEEGGVWTQYFVNGRLEWHPALPPGQRVQLGLLGQAHFQEEMVAVYEAQNFIPGPLAGMTEARVKAAVGFPILYAGDVQVLHVTVTTPDEAAPAAEISLRAIIGYADGQEQTIVLPPTDGTGYSQQTLTLSNLLPGQDVEIRVEAVGTNGVPVGSTQLIFKTWW